MIKTAFCTALTIAFGMRIDNNSDMSFKELNQEIDAQIDYLLMIEDISKLNLEKNEAFHDWLMLTGRQQMPVRLSHMAANLRESNMSRRLFYIYKYEVGRDRASRDDYVEWLAALADWFEDYAAANSNNKS
jgi:hypothetical protein